MSKPTYSTTLLCYQKPYMSIICTHLVVFHWIYSIFNGFSVELANNRHNNQQHNERTTWLINCNHAFTLSSTWWVVRLEVVPTLQQNSDSLLNFQHKLHIFFSISLKLRLLYWLSRWFNRCVLHGMVLCTARLKRNQNQHEKKRIAIIWVKCKYNFNGSLYIMYEKVGKNKKKYQNANENMMHENKQFRKKDFSSFI